MNIISNDVSNDDKYDDDYSIEWLEFDYPVVIDTNLSILILAKNEEATVGAEVRRIRCVYPRSEILVIDNGSTDNTRQEAIDAGASSCIFCETPGKGAAMVCGAKAASGKKILFHDADGEYEIEDTLPLVTDLNMGNWGKMTVGRRSPEDMAWSSRKANGFISRLLKMRFKGNKNVPQDILSGSRAFYREDFLEWPIRSKGFGIETELTTLALKQGFFITEYPVRYTPRTKQDGKKIRFYHLLVCALAALKYYNVSSQWDGVPGKIYTRDTEA